MDFSTCLGVNQSAMNSSQLFCPEGVQVIGVSPCAVASARSEPPTSDDRVGVGCCSGILTSGNCGACAEV